METLVFIVTTRMLQARRTCRRAWDEFLIFLLPIQRVLKHRGQLPPRLSGHGAFRTLALVGAVLPRKRELVNDDDTCITRP